MNVNTIANTIYANRSTAYERTSESAKKNTHLKAANAATDSIEISTEAYELQTQESEEPVELSATSGKDTLQITKGSTDNTFVIHFTDSAQVSRTIARGYIVVNGTKILLSDEVKDRMERTDAQAQKDRENAFAMHFFEQNMAVAKQQSEATKEMATDVAKIFEIASRISRGGKVPPQDEKKLMEYSSELYIMAKNAAMMAKKHEKYDSLYEDEEETASQQNAAAENTSAEWNTYETQMEVSTEARAQITDISEGEVAMPC